MIGSRVLAVAFTAWASAVASAEPNPEDLARGKAHYEAGHALYELGRYHEAITEFAAGYKLTHRPALLLNLGTAYRKVGDLAGAREMYTKYLEVAEPADPYRKQVRDLLVEIDSAQTAAPRATTPPTPPPVLVPATPTAPPPPAPLVAGVATQPRPRSFLRRHWWIFPVAGVVLAGVAVGIYFAVQSPKPACGSTTFGCINP
jgi:tetratricopeptide (TPR) repeat protein